MKAITLWRPWAWAIAHGPKRIENRDWKPPVSIVGQRLAIHAGRTYDAEAESFIRARLRLYGRPVPNRSECLVEGVVAVATVLGFMAERQPGEEIGCSTAAAREALAADPLQGGWFVGEYGWLLGNVRALAQPVPCRGAQGLWTLAPEVDRAVLAQIERTSDG